jgi:hypothetical protein
VVAPDAGKGAFMSLPLALSGASSLGRTGSEFSRTAFDDASRTRCFGFGSGGGAVGCSQKGELVIDQGVGISSVLSMCPAVGIPDYTGDVTTFRRPQTRPLRGSMSARR